MCCGDILYANLNFRTLAYSLMLYLMGLLVYCKSFIVLYTSTTYQSSNEDIYLVLSHNPTATLFHKLLSLLFIHILDIHCPYSSCMYVKVNALYIAVITGNLSNIGLYKQTRINVYALQQIKINRLVRLETASSQFQRNVRVL